VSPLKGVDRRAWKPLDPAMLTSIPRLMTAFDEGAE
jgi:hypothetical protein